ncbi:MAG: hypothetical protein J7497_05635 [Chitinophagaceae bacterium]|nr:hypothetical protein [Chitinophagaceae bacterium]
MKKILFALAMTISLFSCKKDSSDDDTPGCYECTVTQTVVGMDDMNSTSTIEQCDLTGAQAQQVEKSGTVTQTMNMGGETITQKVVTKCNRK